MSSNRSEERLTSREVADRLGVRLETVYAYVSRGLLTSARTPGGRGSTFDRHQVEALLDRERRVRPAGAPTWRGPVVDTDITLIEAGRLYFRGIDAVELTTVAGFDALAHWLWTGQLGPGYLAAPQDAVAIARSAVAALPPFVDVAARLRVAVAAAACADTLRYDLRRHVVVSAARGLVATMVDALPVVEGTVLDDAPLVRRLWSRLTATPPTEALLGCLEAALVLLMDHDLAISTAAARTAASARAHPYAVVATGLSAMESPLHGGASTLAYTVVRDAVARKTDDDARRAVAEHLRADRPLPGFGHPLYPDGDPRAAALLERLATEPTASPIVEAARRLEAASGLQPNVDLALAVLALAAGMPQEAGEAIFAIARSVGWIAHALEEYDEPPLRFRGQGRYRGPRPPQPVPSF